MRILQCNIKTTWPLFYQFCVKNGINLEHEDDWGPWFDCFFEGVLAGRSEPSDGY